MSDPKPAPRGSAAEAERAFHEEDALGKTYDARLLRRLWPIVRTYRWQLMLAMGLLPIGSEPLVAQPRTMRAIIDDGVGRALEARVERPPQHDGDDDDVLHGGRARRYARRGLAIRAQARCQRGWSGSAGRRAPSGARR